MMIRSVYILLLTLICLECSAQLSDFGKVNFSKADSVASKYHGHSLQNLPVLALKLTKHLSTDVEKFRAIYKWVCSNIEYDYNLNERGKRRKAKSAESQNKQWEKQYSRLVFKTLVSDKKTVCSGYAYLVKNLSTFAGLNCITIDGYGRTSQSNVRGNGDANHSWNAVRLNNKWYLCDATWSSGAYDTRLSVFVPNFEESYFLAEPKRFIRNHFPIDEQWTLMEKKPTLNTFLNSPIVYVNAFRNKINTLLPEVFDVETEKGKAVSFQFTKDDAFDGALELQVTEQGNTSTYSPALHQKENAYGIEHTFQRKGHFTVHILLNQKYIATYSVKVI